MVLTEEQIQNLYTFTKKHFVEWYDLQSELVDHLANDIEHIWQSEPNLSFEQARDKAFKKFGIFGFSDIIEKKQNQLNKQYWKLIWKHFKEFFKLPKLVLTAFLIALVYSIIHLVIQKHIVLASITFTTCLLLMYDLHIKHNEVKKRQKVTGKKWLFQNNINALGMFSIIAQIPLNTFNFLRNVNWTTNKEIIASIILVIYLITCYIFTQIIPRKIEEEASKLHPEYNLYQKA